MCVLSKRLYPPLWCILNSIRDGRAYEASSTRNTGNGDTSSAALTFSDVCKLCIAINLEGIASKNMAEQYISSKINRRAYNLSSNLMAALADERHEAGVYLSTMEFLIKTMHVNGEILSQHVAHYRETKKSQQKAWAVKYVEAGKSRPSMRDVAR